jgi:hypothetical protein
MIKGKQISNYSIDLTKLNNSSGQLIEFLGTTKIQVNAVPSNGKDLINLNYLNSRFSNILLELNDLSDVTISNVSNNQLLKYNSSTEL